MGLIAAAAVLAGCSLGKTYSEINPEGAKEDVQRHSGHYELKRVQPETAMVVYTSEGAGHTVEFFTSTTTPPCDGMRKIGNVAYVGRGVVYPWVAKLGAVGSRNKGFLKQERREPGSLFVQARASIADSNAFTSRYGFCGPLTAEFSPELGHAYRVRFLFEGSSCRLAVSDATDPDAMVDVPVRTVAACGK